jgi:hypothetical protein
MFKTFYLAAPCIHHSGSNCSKRSTTTLHSKRLTDRKTL